MRIRLACVAVPVAVLAALVPACSAELSGSNETRPDTPKSPSEPDPKRFSEQSVGHHEIVMTVKGPRQGSVTYIAEDLEPVQHTEVTLPWRKVWRYDDALPSDLALWNLFAQSSSGASFGSITCRITVDGEVVSENQSTGPYAVVMCPGAS